MGCTQIDNGSCVSLHPEAMARAQLLLRYRSVYCQVHEIQVIICNGTMIFSSLTAITKYCTELTTLSDSSSQIFILINTKMVFKHSLKAQ